MDELGGSNNGRLPNRRRMAARSLTLVGREEQEEVGSVFSFLLFEDSLQDEEEILEAWLPIAARCCSMVDMGGF